MLDKVWAQHVIVARPGGEELLFVDLNLVHEGGTFLAFDQMRAEGAVSHRAGVLSAKPFATEAHGR